MYALDIFWIGDIYKLTKGVGDGYKINFRIGKKIKKKEMFLTKGPYYGKL